MTDHTDYEADRNVVLKKSDAKLRPLNFLGLCSKRSRNLPFCTRLTKFEPLLADQIKQICLGNFDAPVVSNICPSLARGRMKRPPALAISTFIMLELQKGQIQ